MRYHKSSDPWGRGSYEIPDLAVAGCSFCGNSPDSPAKEADVRAELEMVREELEYRGIPTQKKYQSTQSGNVCMVKIWLCIDPFGPANKHYAAVQRAEKVVAAWLAMYDSDTKLVHDAV